MSIKNVFIKGVNTAFKIFVDAVVSASYVVTDDDGWGTVVIVKHPCRVLISSFTQEDISTVTFSSLIQPTDVQGLVPGEDLSVIMSTKNTIEVDSTTYDIVAFDTAPMGVLHTLLLRIV